jgi:hypothetical protein
MNIEFVLPCGREGSAQSYVTTPTLHGCGAPRIARLLALAHRLDAMVCSGEVKGYAELARLGHVSPARLSQILLLLHLSAPIQEEILFISPAQARRLPELELRRIAAEPDWNRQLHLFGTLLHK